MPIFNVLGKVKVMIIQDAVSNINKGTDKIANNMPVRNEEEPMNIPERIKEKLNKVKGSITSSRHNIINNSSSGTRGCNERSQIFKEILKEIRITSFSILDEIEYIFRDSKYEEFKESKNYGFEEIKMLNQILSDISFADGGNGYDKIKQRVQESEMRVNHVIQKHLHEITEDIDGFKGSKNTSLKDEFSPEIQNRNVKLSTRLKMLNRIESIIEFENGGIPTNEKIIETKKKQNKHIYEILNKLNNEIERVKNAQRDKINGNKTNAENIATMLSAILARLKRDNGEIHDQNNKINENHKMFWHIEKVIQQILEDQREEEIRSIKTQQDENNQYPKNDIQLIVKNLQREEEEVIEYFKQTINEHPTANMDTEIRRIKNIKLICQKTRFDLFNIPREIVCMIKKIVDIKNIVQKKINKKLKKAGDAIPYTSDTLIKDNLSSMPKKIDQMITEISRGRQEETQNQLNEIINLLNNLIKDNKNQETKKQELTKKGTDTNGKKRHQTEGSSQNIHKNENTVQESNTITNNGTTEDKTGNGNNSSIQSEQILV